MVGRVRGRGRKIERCCLFPSYIFIPLFCENKQQQEAHYSFIPLQLPVKSISQEFRAEEQGGGGEDGSTDEKLIISQLFGGGDTVHLAQKRMYREPTARRCSSQAASARLREKRTDEPFS